jgi:serine/threonine-protein kinase
MRYPNEATYCFVDGSELGALPDPRIGTLLAGRYVIEEVIGEGGMATVYGALHKLTGKAVAIKIMNPMLASDVVVRERFRREAKNAQKLAHPNIIDIFDQGDTEDGTAYIVMERLTGESLAEVVARGPMEVDRAISVMAQVARALARAHDLEIIHRDLKPENVFICKRDDQEVVKLLDFGIAKSRFDSRLTNQGELFGTPQYMAPERITGKDPGPGSDLYALGVVYFEMLTGELPFNAPDIATFFVKHMSEPPPHVRQKNPKVPEALDALIIALLAKDPKDRPVDAHRVHQDLVALMDVREIPAAPETIEEVMPDSDDEPATLANAGVDRWNKRTRVFEEMLRRAYGSRGKAPRELTDVLDKVNFVVDKLATLRQEGLEDQYKLEEIDQRGREGLQTRGSAVDTLGVDLSKSKENVRELHARAKAVAEETAQQAKAYKATLDDVIRWEGRSAGMEPYSDLADAYRAAATAVDTWLASRKAEQALQRELEDAERAAGDLDFQIRELRQNLGVHQQSVDTEREQIEEKLRRIGNETMKLEQQLMELTSNFTQPLRSLPSLEPLFKELESLAAA